MELLTLIPSSQFSAIVDVAGDNIDEDKDPTKSSSSCIIREHLILWQPSSVFFQNVLTHSNTYLEWLLEEYVCLMGISPAKIKKGASYA